ncbi:MAG: ASCH domain-containing protein [Cyanobacteria bacterium RU_5_0]|nr:ASCH domain-containing protein [Cyanobacteria bacterium RU_5_0]
MLIKHQVLERIADGTVTLAFRRWKCPTVKTGGQLRTAVGILAIDEVAVIHVDEITAEAAQKAGYSSCSELLHTLNKNEEGTLYRIKFHFAGQDPREVLREQVNLTDDEFDKVHQTLTQLDLKSQDGSWTMTILRLIKQHPGLRATELAALVHLDTQVLKVKVRKLKSIGLTVSIARGGYQLSPRGCEMLDRLDST